MPASNYILIEVNPCSVGVLLRWRWIAYGLFLFASPLPLCCQCFDYTQHNLCREIETLPFPFLQYNSG